MEEKNTLKVPLLVEQGTSKGSITLQGSLLANDSDFEGVSTTSFQPDERDDTLLMDINNQTIDVNNQNFTKAVRNNLQGSKQDFDMGIMPFKRMSEKQLERLKKQGKKTAVGVLNVQNMSGQQQPQKKSFCARLFSSCFGLNKRKFFFLKRKKETILDIIESLYINYEKDLVYLLWETRTRHFMENKKFVDNIRYFLPQIV